MEVFGSLRLAVIICHQASHRQAMSQRYTMVMMVHADREGWQALTTPPEWPLLRHRQEPLL